MTGPLPFSNPWPAGRWLLGLLALGLVWAWPDVDRVRGLIRLTAWTSLGCFLVAYGAQAAATRWPSALTQGWRRHRRQWGWLLVGSHAIHLAGILAYRHLDPALFAANVPASNWVTGGLAYGLLALMGLTSFDRTAQALGPRAWSALHRWGSLYLWLSFLVAFGKRVPLSPVYLVPVLALLGVMGLRVWCRRQAAGGAAEPRGVPLSRK